MLAPQYAVTAPPTDRVEIVVLRVALAAEPCIRVPASRASVAVSIPCALGPPDLGRNQCRHFVSPCLCVEAATEGRHADGHGVVGPEAEDDEHGDSQRIQADQSAVARAFGVSRQTVWRAEQPE